MAGAGVQDERAKGIKWFGGFSKHRGLGVLRQTGVHGWVQARGAR